MEELCCISVLGEMSAAEQQELDAHLLECADCRKLQHDLRQIAYFDLSVLAGDRMAGASTERVALDHPDRLLSQVLEKARQGRAQTAPAPSSQTGEHPSQRRWSFSQMFFKPLVWSLAGAGLAALLLGTVQPWAPWWVQKASPQAGPVHPVLVQQSPLVQQQKENTAAVNGDHEALQAELKRLRKDEANEVSALNQLQTAYQNSLSQQASLEQQLSEANLTAKTLDSQLEGTRASLAQERQDKLSLKAQLDEAIIPLREEQRKAAAQGPVPSVETSNAKPMVTDAEARELFGARDLHIVDVYDVDRSGKTKRTYGRVYYVDRRLLLFYAFDLGDKKADRTLASFQAWGYREPNSSKAENLGLFRVDDASLKRWVLRVTNADVLTRIDTVFVTLEPPHGSPYPRGKKLLFASLMGPANHP